jgi:YVTN family beta-propeller protein
MRKILILTLVFFILWVNSNLAFAGGRDMQKKIIGDYGMVCGAIFIPPTPGTSGGQTPAQGARVTLQGTNFMTQTDSSGAFQFINVPPGNYAIMAVKEGYGPATKQIEVKRGGACSVFLTLGAGGMPVVGAGTSIIPSNTIYVAFASNAPAASTTPGSFTPGVTPSVGSMTSFGVLSQLQYSADPFSIGGGNPAISSPPPMSPYGNMGNTPAGMPNMAQSGYLPSNVPSSFDNQMMVSTNPNNIMILDPFEAQKVSYIAPAGKPYWLCFNVSGTKLFTAVDGGMIEVYDILNNNTKLAVIPAQGAVSDMVANPRGGQIYAAVKGANPAILVLSTSTNTVESRIPVPAMRSGVPGMPNALGISPDGKILFIALTSGNQGEVAILELSGQHLLGNIPVGDMPQGIAVSPDGKHIYVTNYNSASLSIIDVAGFSETMRLRVGVQPVKAVLSLDGAKLYVSENGSNDVAVVDTRTGRVLANIPVGRAPMGIGITSDGKRVFVANNGDGTVSVIDTQVDKVIRTTQPLPRCSPFGVAVKP